MKRAAIYARVSTTEQADTGTSLDTQVAACQRYATDNGYRVVATFRDDATGSTLNRPGLEQLRELAEKREIDAVIFYSLDRLSRNDTNTHVLAHELRQKRVALECATVRLEDTPAGAFLFSILAAQADFEHTQILERTRRGRNQRARQGNVLVSSRVPYGYAYEVGSGKLTPDPQEAPWLRQMYEWVAQDGLTMHAVAKRLTEQGVPTKHGIRGWYDSVVNRIIRSPTYRGEWQYGKNGSSPITVPVPPLVDDATWHKAQETLRRNRDMSPRNVKHDYLLRGLLFCGEDNMRLTGYAVKNPQKRQYFYYRCPHRESYRILWSGDNCTLPLRPAAPLEGAVWDGVIGLLSGVPNREELAAEEFQPETSVYDAQTVIAEAQLRKVATQESALVDMHLDGDITREVYRERVGALHKRQAEIKAQLQEIKDQREAEIDRASRMQEVVEGLALLGGAPTFEDKRRFLLSAVKRITVYRDHVHLDTHFGAAVLQV